MRGGRIEIGTDAADAYIEISFGDSVGMTADKIRALMTDAGAAAGITPTKGSASFNEITFSTGKDYKVFTDAMKLDFTALSWTQ